MSEDTKKEVSFKDTLNLPTTDFPIRSNAAQEDKIILEQWEKEQLYTRCFEHNKGSKKGSFVLHDGPPYANANIHLGTAYNKILKDIITKAQRMMGKHVPVTPGWDCHGLPIELKVTEAHPTLRDSELKKACRAYASKWIDIQRQEFKALGVIMDWNNPYKTMNPEYEAQTVRAFGHAVKHGYISRKNKTVPWCASCQTVLAAAEIEYHDRKDPSIYVRFELAKNDSKKLFPGVAQVSLLVWTTTPWTLPLNRAVFLKPGSEYVLLAINDQHVLVGAPVADKVCATLGVEKVIVGRCKAEDLVGLQVAHPFIEQFTVPVLADGFVGLDEGTACVHSAPGCGPEDYEMGIRYGLEIYSPLTPDGKYTDEIKPQELAGMSIADALGWVMTKLQAANTLLFKTSIKHSYPHCWRCRNGLMFRATKQWFCELHHHDLQERALEAVENKITFLPAATKNHLKAAVGGRLEWCLSRQRTWGTPIIAVLCNDCDTEYVTPEMVEHVADTIAQVGCEVWDEVPLTELVPKGHVCTSCGSKNFRKERDILDVWFDAGVSHYAVLRKNAELGYPADLYLEGVDQHRGWFQSSLLTSLMLEKEPCMRAIATHGYTVDDKGRKMSKSLGNVIAPQTMIDRLGTDGLRLWVSSIEMQGDVVVSEKLLANVQEVNRKIRNTCRFLLSNLYDYNHAQDAVDPKKLLMIDQYALAELGRVSDKIQRAYDAKNLTSVFHALADYCAGDLSAFYLDIIKDRLYTDQADGHARRSAQTVCWYILDALTTLMAPIMSFTAEHVARCYQGADAGSVHLQNFAVIPSVWLKEDMEVKGKKREQWQALLYVRAQVLKTLEQLRKRGIIKHSLESGVTITMNVRSKNMALVQEVLAEVEAAGQKREEFLKEFFIISACEIVEVDEDEYDNLEIEECDDEECEMLLDDAQDLMVKGAHAPGSKCPRCWQWEMTDHKDGLCLRCQKVVARLIH